MSAYQVVVGVVLLWAGGLKLLHRNASTAARRSVLARLVGTDRVVGAYRAVGVAEVAVGLLVFLYPTAAYAAAALSAGMLGYLAYGRLKAPDSSCGCLGDEAHTGAGPWFRPCRPAAGAEHRCRDRHHLAEQST